MDKVDEVNEYLIEFGLDEEDIFSIKNRNDYLKVTVKEDMQRVLSFLQRNCKLSKKEIRHIIVNNPFILSESMQRISLLDSIYKNIGFKGEEYKEYLTTFEKALSLNPRGVFEKIESMASNGKTKNDIKSSIIKNGYEIFKNCM